MGVGFQSKSLGFKRNCTTARKRVKELRQFTFNAVSNFLLCRINHLYIIGIVPKYQLLKNAEEPLAFFRLFFLRRKLIWMRRWIINQ